MNKRHNRFRSFFNTNLVILMLLSPLPLLAQQDAQQSLSEAEQQELRRQREEMMTAIEKTRNEIERVAEEARVKAQALREETQKLRTETSELARQSEQAREEARAELAREREELSRTHRELRRASQEVARAYRELSLAEDREMRTRTINLGDRAMLGVILGNETDQGIEIIGVSPDGPAERAGIQSGDTLMSLRGEDLALSADTSPREIVYEIMSDVGEGEEISANVLRDGNHLDLMVKPERREPASWASYIRLPEPVVAPAAPAAPGSAATPVDPAEPLAPHISIERIAVPPMNTAVIAAEALALADELETFHFRIEEGDGELTEYSYEIDIDPSDFEFDTEAFSEFGSMAIDEARVWFGASATLGIQFASLNDGLAGYFDTNTGLLVLEAPEDNSFGLMAGDVVLKVGDSQINAISDFIRALRAHESGDEVAVQIKRNKRNVTLDAVVPENRFGLYESDTSGEAIVARFLKTHDEE
ncbi:MAG TPA: PDZ domain-containing protein [Xanthomonadales bacterium]|nr:PDZ domain-containing protein [Xanthomonadales bacterium]